MCVLERIQESMMSYGIIHYQTEQAADAVQNLSIVVDDRPTDVVSLHCDGGEDVYSFTDEVADGYIIGHKRDRAELKNRWALKANGVSIKLVWIDSSERMGIVYHDKIIMEEDAWCTCAPGYSNTKMWPLREGYIPVPSKHTRIEALPNPFSL